MRPLRTGHGSGRITRRQFISASLGTAAAWSVLPAGALARATARAPALVPADRPLRLAVAGIGNRGLEMLKTFASTNLTSVAALCDVDLDAPHTAEARELFPMAPRFRDLRAMLDQAGAEIDAVVIATPDHTHFPLAMHAMAAGKHIYLEKPLAQTFREADRLIAMAARSGVVTQMGNQGHSGNNYFQFKAWTEAGIIADVTKIVMFMNSERRWHGWTVDGFPSGEPMPPGLDWDLWHAARPMHPFSAKLHPQTWRGWFDYGNGAFGDWGPHILDTSHRFLELGLPHTIEAVHRDQPSPYIFPQASTIRFDFAARASKPPVEVFWYDGVANKPPLPAELGPGAVLQEQAGKFIYSRTLVFKGGTHGETLRIIPEARMQELAPTLPKIAGGFSDHPTNFILACQGKEESRSPFRVSGPLTQVFLLGVIAQRLGGRLEFDSDRRVFTNNAEATAMLAGPAPRPGWEGYYRG
ncbi:MAG: Gfo/Idh/MocA family oxidoreductase [Vicinamibacterales bacterium]|nr:Gfo/Idh/MocA family oxidoreductase [Vicinamibacterales bacterium]